MAHLNPDVVASPASSSPRTNKYHQSSPSAYNTSADELEDVLSSRSPLSSNNRNNSSYTLSDQPTKDSPIIPEEALLLASSNPKQRFSLPTKQNRSISTASVDLSDKTETIPVLSQTTRISGAGEKERLEQDFEEAKMARLLPTALDKPLDRTSTSSSTTEHLQFLDTEAGVLRSPPSPTTHVQNIPGCDMKSALSKMSFDDDSQYWILCLPRRSQTDDKDELDDMSPTSPPVPHSQFDGRSRRAQNAMIPLRDSDGLDRMMVSFLPEQHRHVPAAAVRISLRVGGEPLLGRELEATNLPHNFCERRRDPPQTRVTLRVGGERHFSAHVLKATNLPTSFFSTEHASSTGTGIQTLDDERRYLAYRARKNRNQRNYKAREKAKKEKAKLEDTDTTLTTVDKELSEAERLSAENEKYLAYRARKNRNKRDYNAREKAKKEALAKKKDDDGVKAQTEEEKYLAYRARKNKNKSDHKAREKAKKDALAKKKLLTNDETDGDGEVKAQTEEEKYLAYRARKNKNQRDYTAREKAKKDALGIQTATREEKLLAYRARKNTNQRDYKARQRARAVVKKLQEAMSGHAGSVGGDGTKRKNHLTPKEIDSLIRRKKIEFQYWQETIDDLGEEIGEEANEGKSCKLMSQNVLAALTILDKMCGESVYSKDRKMEQLEKMVEYQQNCLQELRDIAGLQEVRDFA